MKIASSSSTGHFYSCGVQHAIPLLFALLLAAPCIQAQTSYYWQTTPPSGSWSSAANWADSQGGTSGGVVPSGLNSAVFDSSSQTAINFTTGSYDVSSMIFNAGSPAYTFTLGNNRVLSLGGAGVVNNSTTTKPTFAVNSGGTLNFNGASSAANGTVNVGNGGTLYFNGVSSAGTAAITVNNSSGFNPQLYFTATSTAGSANINVNSGVQAYFTGNSSAGNATFGWTGAGGGEIQFFDNTTASNATILVGHYNFYNNNSTAGNATLNTVNADSEIWFNDTSSAGNATINVGTTSNNGGYLFFYGASTGGTAVVNTGNGASVVFSENSNSVITLGSIAGSGNFYLGDKTLTVGSKNLNTEVSGSLLEAFRYPYTTGGSLIKVGTGTLTLSGANTFSGSTVVQGGAILVTNSDGLAGSTLSYNNGDGLVSFTTLTKVNLGGLTGNHDLTLANPNGDAMTLSVGANGNSTTYSGALSGAGMLVKTGTGTLTLSGMNTQAGGVQVTNGVFKLAPGATFGGGLLNVTGGAFDLDGGAYTLGNLVVNGGTVRNGTLDTSTFLAISGTISAGITGGEFVKSGTGSLTLSGVNTYTGPTTITGGGLLVAPGSLPSGSYYRLNGGAIGVGAGNPTSYVAGTGAGEVSWEGDGGFAAYGGTRTITFNGSGTQTWGQGGFAPDGSALILGAYGSDSLTIFANDIDLNGSARTVRVENGSAALDATLSGVLSNGSLVKTGDGTLNLTGANSYAGGTRIAGGLIQFAALSDMGSGPILLDGGGLKWSVGSTTDASGSVSYGNGGSIFDTNGNNVVFATAVGTGTAGGTTAGGLTKLGTGTLTLQGNSQYTGTTTVSQGTLVVTGNNSATGDLVAAAGATIVASGNAGALGSGTVTINTGTSLRLAYDTNTNFGAGIRFSGDSPTVLFNRATNGAGITYNFKDAFFEGTTGGQNVTFTRGPFASSGTTTVGFDNVSTGLDVTLTLSSSMRVNMGSLAIGTNHGFTLGGTAAATTLTIGALSGTNSGLYTLSNSQANVQFTGAITGQDLIVTLYSTGTKTFSSASTFTGTTDLWQGSVVVGDNAAFGQSTLALDTLTIQSNGPARTIGNRLDLFSNVNFSGTSNLTFTGLLTNVQGSLGGSANNTITVSNTGTTTFGNVNLAYSSVNRTVTFSTSAGANAVINGTIANGSTSTASNLTKTGVGNLTLSGSNTYSGTSTLTAGNLIIGHNSALGGSTLNFNGGTLSGDGTARTLTNAVSINATSAIAGASDLTFTGNLALGSSARILTVNNTGATIFSGTVNGSGAFTKSGTGVLTLSGTNTYTGKTTVSAGTLAVTSLANINSASSLGAPTSAANGTIDIGATGTSATLKYIGAGSTSNRVINLAGTSGGATIDSSGSGALVLNAAAFTATGAGSKTLTLAGTNAGANTVASTIVNNSGANTTSLNKTGSGLWRVGGANTFTGSTTIREGTLSASKIAVTGGNSSLGNATSAIVLGDTSTAGTLLYTGISATYTRGFTVNAGGGEFSTSTSGQTTTIGTGNITTAGRFTVSGSGNTTITTSISGTGSLAKSGSGLLTLTGTSSYSGVTTIDGGIFLLEGELTGTSLVDMTDGAIGGDGIIGGSLHFGLGTGLVFDPSKTLTIIGTAVTFDGFSIADIVGLDSSVALGTYTLLDGPTTFDFTNVTNFGADNAYALGDGKSAYFQSGSLNIVVVPEPSTWALIGLGIGVLVWHRRRSLVSR